MVVETDCEEKASSVSFYGIFAAITTPFRQGIVDFDALERHVDFLVHAGVAGVVPTGSTGEALALTRQERQDIIRVCRHVAGNKALVIPGTGAALWEDALAYTQDAEGQGADGALVMPPYFVKPDPDAIFNYFQKIHGATSLPLILYNNPARCGVNLETSLLQRIAACCPRVRGIKESSPDLGPLLTRVPLLPRWSFLCGEDGLFPAFLGQGGHGIISVGANVVPQLYVEMLQAWQTGDTRRMDHLRKKLGLLTTHVLGLGPNPAPIQYACSLMGFGDGQMRLPLSEMRTQQKESISRTLQILENDSLENDFGKNDSWEEDAS